MKKLFLILAVGLLVLSEFTAFSEEIKLPRLAVVEFSINDSKNPKLVNDAVAVRNQVQSNIVKIGRYDVIARAEIDKLLENQKIQVSSISSKENIKKLQLQNISYLVTGTVDAMDSDYLVTLKILDVATGNFINSDEEFMGNSSSDTYRGVKVLTGRFLSNITGSGEEIVSSNKIKFIDTSEDFILVEGSKIGDFEICKHEVTQKEFASILRRNPSNFQEENTENYPVENVTWFDAIEYCNKRSVREGLTPCYSYEGEQNIDNWSIYTLKNTSNAWRNIKCNFDANGYRLPTENEWMYAAKGGINSHGYIYSGSNDSDDVAWDYGNSGHKTHEVMTKMANEIGLFDMSGNVAEWGWDRNESEFISNPIYSFGGDFRHAERFDGHIIHHTFDPKVKTDGLGFRVVRSVVK